jgi:hypothetical protein
MWLGAGSLTVVVVPPILRRNRLQRTTETNYGSTIPMALREALTGNTVVVLVQARDIPIVREVRVKPSLCLCLRGEIWTVLAIAWIRRDCIGRSCRTHRC